MVSCQKGPTRHAYAWQIGPFWYPRCMYLSLIMIHLRCEIKWCHLSHLCYLWNCIVAFSSIICLALTCYSRPIGLRMNSCPMDRVTCGLSHRTLTPIYISYILQHQLMWKKIQLDWHWVIYYSTLMVILPMPYWGCRVKPHGMAVPSDAFTHIIPFLFIFSIW